MSSKSTHIRELLPSSHYPFGTMVGLITDAITASPLSLHFTKLNESGERGQRRLLSGMPKKRGVIRLCPDEEITLGLTIAEGIETALSVPPPVWASIDAGNMSIFPVLAGIECLTLAADNDKPGLDAAKKCMARWLSAGSEVRIVVPSQGDWNDRQSG